MPGACLEHGGQAELCFLIRLALKMAESNLNSEKFALSGMPGTCLEPALWTLLLLGVKLPSRNFQLESLILAKQVQRSVSLLAWIYQGAYNI